MKEDKKKENKKAETKETTKKTTGTNKNVKKETNPKATKTKQDVKKETTKKITDAKKEVKKVDNKKEKVKKEKNKKSNKKDKKPNKFIETIKKKWLIDGTKTTLLILIIVALFIGINMFMQSLELTPIDITEDKLYTLSDESKDKVKNIEKDVNLFFIGYADSDSIVDLAKQYGKENERIVTEAVDSTSRPDLVQKYGIDSSSTGIIVECGDKSKVLTANDLSSYDVSGNVVDISEEALTSAIENVSADKIPKVYFLTGYTDFTLDNTLYSLNVYLQNEIMEVNSLNLLSTGVVPEDCDTLVITTPNKDFDDLATNAIINYINSGKNILWFNAAVTTNVDMPNVNKVLESYGIDPFSVGIIRETNSENMATSQPDAILPETQYSTITEDIYKSGGSALMVNATKINLNETKMEEMKVEETDLLLASEDAYFRTDFTIQTDAAADGEEFGTFVVGAELEKTISEANEEENTAAVKSKMVIFGENYFISDYTLGSSSSSSGYGIFMYADNKNIAINSIAYLTDREDDITSRKSTSTITYTATEEQNTMILCIIFIVPIVIVVAGIVVWQVRRRRK